MGPRAPGTEMYNVSWLHLLAADVETGPGWTGSVARKVQCAGIVAH